MSGLLVSVRDAAEALAALEGGASLIDVKEPSRGALGRADDDVIQSVIDAVAGRVPVSAAMGELPESDVVPSVTGLAFAKWGLPHDDWPWAAALHDRRRRAPCPVVPCAYADEAIDGFAPTPDSVCRFAIEHRFQAILIDTCSKRGHTLLDYLTLAALARIAERCRDAGVKVALAGSLNAGAITALRPLRPDWFAVRGAACDGGREGRVSTARVRGLVKLLA